MCDAGDRNPNGHHVLRLQGEIGLGPLEPLVQVRTLGGLSLKKQLRGFPLAPARVQQRDDPPGQAPDLDVARRISSAVTSLQRPIILVERVLGHVLRNDGVEIIPSE